MEILKDKLSLENQLVFIFCGLGCIACFILQKYLPIPGFLASIFVGLVAGLIPKFSVDRLKQAPSCIYAGSFAAMCSLSLFSSFVEVLLLSLLVGVYFHICNPYFKGLGGKLGSIAFLSSLSFVLLKAVL